jgi:hypothetical protein
MEKHGPIEYKANDGNTYRVTEAGVAEILAKAETKLNEVLPMEFVRGEGGEQRHTDAALVNALFLGSVSGKPLVTDAMAVQIINTLERERDCPSELWLEQCQQSMPLKVTAIIWCEETAPRFAQLSRQARLRMVRSDCSTPIVKIEISID